MKFKTISKKICLVSSFFLMLNSSVHIVQPAVGNTWRNVGSSIRETFRAKLPGLISNAKSQAKSSLAAAYQKVKGIKAEVIIDRLLANVSKMGGQVGKIKDCMISGSQCSSSERAAFYATAITILALTAAIVGFNITVVNNSNKTEQGVKKSMENTLKEVEGLKPATVFQRLSNKLSSFKLSLLSMKQCLTKRHCTRAQKRTLYATAATIVALVTITIGIGVGSYIYAQKQEATRQIEEAKRLEEEKVPTKSEPVKQFSEQELKNLAVNQAKEQLEEPKSTFQKFMQKAIAVKEKGKTAIQEASEQIRVAIQEKSSKAQEALKTTGDAATKLALFQAAKAALERAEGIASSFIAKIRSIDIVESVQQILHIDLMTFIRSVSKIKSSSVEINEPLNKLSNVELFKQINQMVRRITKWQTMGMNLYNQATELAKQLWQRSIHTTRLGTWKWGEEEEGEYPLANQFDQLVKVYPELVTRINSLDLATPGRLLNFALRDAAQILESAANLKISIGNNELSFLSPDIRTALTTLNAQLVQLAGFIGSTTQMRPIIKSPVDISIATSATAKQFLTTSIRNITSPTTFKENIDRALTLPEIISGYNEALNAQTDQLQDSLEVLTNRLSTTPQNVLTSFVELVDVKGKRLQNIAHAPQLLQRAMAIQLELLKKHLSETLQVGNRVIDHLAKVLQYSAELLNAINALMGAEHVSYVNEDIIYGFKQMASIISNMVTIVNKLNIDVTRQQLPVIAPAS